MAKEPETTTPATTTRPGFKTEVTDAPDAALPPSDKTKEEMAAGVAALKAQPAGAVRPPANPADADPIRAAEVAMEMNREHARRDYEEADPVPEGDIPPGEVPSKGYTYVPPPGEAVEADRVELEKQEPAREYSEKAREREREQKEREREREREREQRERERSRKK